MSGPAKALVLPIGHDAERLARAHGTTFLVTSRSGDIDPPGARDLGLFHDDMRHLSHYALSLGEGGELVHLSSDTSHHAYNQVDLMLSANEDKKLLDDPKNFLHVRRRQVIDGGLIEEIAFTNFLQRTLAVTLRIDLGADFADMFEVRGARRERRGCYEPPVAQDGALVFAYRGTDGALYSTTITFSPAPSHVAADHVFHELVLPPDHREVVEVRVLPSRDGITRSPRSQVFVRRADAISREGQAFREASARWTADDGLLQQVLEQSAFDLSTLLVKIGDLSIVGAGIPWFCAPFGRDALITAYEALALNPDVATDALRTLAAYQGKKTEPRTEEEPGKIFHELRFGEMARAGEVPHSPYYGSIDATPLFVVLCDAAHQMTADHAFLEELGPAIRAALGWIDARSEEGTKLVTYERKTEAGLDNQGWKDSRAGVSFPDGRRAEPPIALCEVQGYCIDAYVRGARVLDRLGETALADAYLARATTLRETFERIFWMEEAGRYAFAVDGRGRVVPTIVSNTGHLLFSRAVSHAHAVKTAQTLLASNMYAGFGIRTLASEQPVYNPLSYHNGTVWPHDNALIAKGFANYGLMAGAAKVFEGMYAAMRFFRDRRLPELFCGIGRRSGPLVRYPVACSPQAWSAAAPFLLLRSMLGIHADAPRSRLTIKNPMLPAPLKRIEVRKMRVGGSLVSARFRRVGDRCHVDVLDVNGAPIKIEIVIE